eukprot:scaffold35866_cov124-Isochrysis_galbana.AAC.3
MNTSETTEAEAPKGGALRRYERVGSSVATTRPERSVAHSPSSTDGASSGDEDRFASVEALPRLAAADRPLSARLGGANTPDPPASASTAFLSCEPIGFPSGCCEASAPIPSSGKMQWSGGTISKQRPKQTAKGRRKAWADASGRSYSTPPTTGPTMQPTPDTVPIEAMTVPNLSEKRSVARMMAAFSAMEPSRPVRK